VRVAEEVGEGPIKVTLSFSAWKAGRVASTTTEIIPVEE
jgi:hypothetical protein